MISRKGPDHGRPIGRIEMADEKCLLGRCQVCRRPLRIFQEEIGHGARTQFCQLQQKGGSEIERRLNIGKLGHEKGHVEIRFGRVEAHPRHAGGPRDGSV